MIWLLIIIIIMIILTYPPLVTAEGLEQHPLWGIFYSIPAFYAMPFILFHLSNEYDSKLLTIIAILQIIINIGIIVYGYSERLWVSIMSVMALNVVTFIIRILITISFLYFSYRILFWIPESNQALPIFIKEQFMPEIVEMVSEIKNKSKAKIVEYETNTESSTILLQTESNLESELNISQDWSKSGNIINGGHAVYDGTSYYIGDSSLYELNTDGQKKILLDKQVDYINESGNYLYFVIDDESKICRMCKDGSNLTKLSEYQVHELTLYNDVLYFIMTSEGETNKICRMNTDGSDFTELYYSNNGIWYMNIWKDFVYFTDLNENRNIKCMSTDGSDIHTINNARCYDVIVINDKIYYSKDKDSRYLYQMDLNGNNQTQLNSIYSRNINYLNGYLYYRDDNYNMHRCELNGQNDNIICNNGNVTFITLAPDKIYYRPNGENSGLKEITFFNAEDASNNIIIITLYPDKAPITCENFEKLVSEGFYDGLTFHRVVDDFVAQGGDPQGLGKEGSDKTIKGEFSSNGIENDLSHQRGIVSMARNSDPDGASSQFFICYTDCSFLDGNYAAFGKVTQGMEIVDSFLNIERVIGSDGDVSFPITPIKMDKVTMMQPDENGNPRIQIIMSDFLNFKKDANEEYGKENEIENLTEKSQNNKKFEVYTDAVTWQEAKQKCIEKGGHLAYITCREDYDTILLKLSSVELRYLWVGATTTISENNVYSSWLDGTSLDFINNNNLWYPGEPSGRDVTSSEKNIEPYVMLWNIKGEWSFNDNSDISLQIYKKKYFGYICEFEE